MKRRELLKEAIAWIAALLSAGAAGLLLSVYPAGVRKKKLEFFPVLNAEDAPRRGVKNITVPYVAGGRKFETRAFLVADGGGLIALSSRCTHLGCSVSWDRNRNEFICPCHGGRYDIAGNRLAGPPPAPLERMPVKIDGDRIHVGIMV